MFNPNQLSTMKKVVILTAACFVALAAVAHEWTSLTAALPFTKANAVFAWMETEHDFGKIPIHKPVAHEFLFTNTGDAPLLISSVTTSCGCTVSEYSKDPIPPGARGYVKATYNAAKAGAFNKTVTINANVEGEAVKLTVKGVVTE
jgi:hypothetical protein